MKKLILIYILASSVFCIRATGQSYFKIIPGSVQMQVLSKNGDSLALGYHVAYFDSSNSSYSGIITTNYITKLNKDAGTCTDVFNTADLPEKKLNNGDTVFIYTHIKVSSHYFENGSGNIIVIWPTGDKNGKKTYCKDSVAYPKSITVVNLAGISDPENAFNPVRVFPSPANTWLNVEMTDLTQKNKTLRVNDISGKTVITIKNATDKINVSGLKAGTYFLEVECTDAQKATYKFMIAK